jgi:hypothetical protein
VTKKVVQPGRKNGGTTLIFSLRRQTVLVFTIVRVYPSCERVGSFRVRARRGVNRVRFSGRFRGRPLPEGTYRLVVHARGHARAAAAVTIVVARGQLSQAFLRRAQNANSCSQAEASEILTAVGASASGGTHNPSGTAAADKSGPGVLLRLAGGVKGVTRKVSTVDDELLSDPLMLVFGLMTLASACLGTFVLVRLARAARSRPLH